MSQRYPSAQAYANRRSVLRIVWSGKSHDRHVEIGRLPFVLGGIAVLLLCSWYLVATAYLIFRDEMLAGLMRSQAEMQYAYEDRIASLRAHLDRVASRQLVDQDSFEGRVEELMSRQAKLETRSEVLAGLATKAVQLGVETVAPIAGAKPAEIEPAAQRKSKPLPEGMQLDQQSAVPSVTGALAFGALRMDNGVAGQNSIAQQIEAVGQSLAMIETQQSTALARLERELGEAPARFHTVLDAIGLDQKRFRSREKTDDGEGGIGGPLVPMTGEAGDFAESVNRIQKAIRQQTLYSHAFDSIPLRRPVPRTAAITSGFGPRSDPFLARAAMHSGIDFRGDTGDAARATAPGRVVEAGINGGYGKMIEVDHGFGLTTRYAHLSAFDVEAGDIVERGQIIGRIGSTGRSTGPHLHYEIRIDGEAVDPMRFLRAAQRLN